MAGTHPDLLWARTPEGKHEFPIDTMREFCALLARKPTRGGRKVGIVEDADDFNQESANAFLKTLEEPPPGTLLLLLATSIDRQLPTILSRCQVIRFRALSPSDLSAVLVEKEVDDAARRDRLVRLAGGSVSRALALNDEAIWKLREELIAGITSARPDYHRLGTSWSQYVEEAAKDTVAKRTRASALIGFLLDMLRQSLRIGLGANTSLMETSEEARLRAFADRLGPDRLLTLIDRCVEADYRVERRVELNLICDWVMSQFQQASSPMQPSAASRK
jgi:DNA polymerase-3 subunit delta'